MQKIISEPSLRKDPNTGAVLLEDSTIYNQYMNAIANIEENKSRLANLEISVLELNNSVLTLANLIKDLYKK